MLGTDIHRLVGTDFQQKYINLQSQQPFISTRITIYEVLQESTIHITRSETESDKIRKQS